MSMVVLVTGAASGIGAAVARHYAAGGARLVLADVDEAGGSVLADQLGGRFVRTDVADESDNHAMADAALTAYGRLDLVLLNAGAGGAGGFGPDFDLARYRRTIAVNLDGTVFGVRAVLPALTASGGGSIVVTSSIAGVTASPFDPFYSATKYAIVGLVRSAAAMWSHSPVRINAICPGFVETPGLGRARDIVHQRGWAIADPAEVATAVESIVAGGETGQAWVVQAGRAPQRVPITPVDLPKATS